MNGKACLQTCYKHCTLLTIPPSADSLEANHTTNGLAVERANKMIRNTCSNVPCERELDRCARLCGIHGEMSHMKLTIVLKSWAPVLELDVICSDTNVFSPLSNAVEIERIHTSRRVLLRTEQKKEWWHNEVEISSQAIFVWEFLSMLLWVSFVKFS